MVTKFPQVIGDNLSGEEKTIPNDLDGEINIVIIAFQRWQQAWVDSWVPTLEQLKSQYPFLEYYELPTLRRLNFLARRFIDGGMRAGIPSEATRRRTITLYIDKASFKNALSIENEDSIYLYVLRRDGEILFQTSGPYSLESEEQLLELMKNRDDTHQLS